MSSTAPSAATSQSGTVLAHKPKDDTARLQKAATEFEALLIEQILKETHANDENKENSTLRDLGEQQLAQALASSGALGIGKMVIAGLTKHANR